MRFALVNPNWDFEGSTYFGCRDPHIPLELLFAQDGTLYARTATQQLFSLTPMQSLHIDLTQPQMKTNTVYAADTLGTVPKLSLKKDMRVTFKAEKGIGFASGFSVELGATLRCQIGF